ncbi:hypothetical protein A9Q87_11075 [Flavobacteriales bacterium 34_180_T64]|nr:hypothetical protein A9Q87_11075 [Flavobacteriales bacterium 34_180_T64]
MGTINGSELPSSYCDGSTNSSNVDFAEWLKYTPDSDYTVTISSDLVINADKDTKVNIYTGSCGALTCVIGDDDSGVYPGSNTYSYLSYITFNVTLGQTYYVVWDDERSNSSNFDFTLTEETTVPPSSASAAVSFTSQSANISGTYDRALVDMNGDYLDDLVSISTSSIYVNLQNGSGFDVVQKTTTSADFLPTWSLAAGDYNADGYSDLLYGGGDGVTFMRSNQTGASGFDTVEFIEISGPEDVFSQRSNFVDINNDGHLDAFVCHDTAPSISYMNDGSNNLVFENTNGLGDYFFGGNYASVWIDFDNDKDIDMYMAKCGGSDARKTNQLYRNNGDGTYTEIGSSSGLADIIQTWSAAWGDFDNDGDMDAYVGSSTRHDHKLMRNNGDLTFTDVTNGSGVGLANQGIENAPADFNNDGFLDILSNGSVLFGNGDLTFNVFAGPISGSIGDVNNDGFLDVFNGSLYINDTNSNNWIKIVTVGDQSGGYSNINGIGARVEINTASGTQIRDVTSGIGFRHMSSLNTHFGIGADTAINYIRIFWPSGIIDTINNPTINDSIIINEGSSTLGTNDYFAEDLILYPNPTKDVLNLNSIELLNGAFYTVFDMTGKRVVNATLKSTRIDVSHLSSGNYILRIMSGNQIKSQKFIKQ